MRSSALPTFLVSASELVFGASLVDVVVHTSGISPVFDETRNGQIWQQLSEYTTHGGEVDH